jgi:hypothetical protein
VEQPEKKGDEFEDAAASSTGGDKSDNGGSGYSFKLNEENLEKIMSKIRKGVKVSVVSVVGNFRTGKSFLLTFMLRYLRNRHCKGAAWQTEDGNSLTEGNANKPEGGGDDDGIVRCLFDDSVFQSFAPVHQCIAASIHASRFVDRRSIQQANPPP